MAVILWPHVDKIYRTLVETIAFRTLTENIVLRFCVKVNACLIHSEISLAFIAQTYCANPKLPCEPLPKSYSCCRLGQLCSWTGLWGRSFMVRRRTCQSLKSLNKRHFGWWATCSAGSPTSSPSCHSCCCRPFWPGRDGSRTHWFRSFWLLRMLTLLQCLRLPRRLAWC